MKVLPRVLVCCAATALLAPAAWPQNVRGFLLGGELATTEKGDLPRFLVTAKFLGRNIITARTEVTSPRSSGDGKAVIFASLPSQAPLSNLEYIRFDLIPSPTALRRVALKNITAGPILDLPGFPRELGPLGSLLALTSEGERIREFYGVPAMAVSQADVVLEERKPLFLRPTRNDMKGPITRRLRTTLGVSDGIRADSSMTLALKTYDGRLLKVESGAFRDNSRASGEHDLPIPIGPRHFANLQAYFLKRDFESGSSLPGAPAGATGDDARFSFTLESEPGERLHRLTGLSLQDTTNGSFSFPDAYQQTPGAFWCDALSFWIQTGERGLAPGVPVTLTLHLKNGQVLSTNMPIVAPGFRAAARAGGCGSFMVWLTGMRLSPSRGRVKDPMEPDGSGLPIHGIERISLSIIRPRTGDAPREVAWDIKSLIITAGRGSGTFPIWADGLERVNLVSLPQWNKTLKMEGASGPSGAAFQQSVLTPKRIQSYTFNFVNE